MPCILLYDPPLTVTALPQPPELAHEQIPEAERANYQKQITNSMQMLKSFDHILTLEFAMRPQRQNDPEVINLYKVVCCVLQFPVEFIVNLTLCH